MSPSSTLRYLLDTNTLVHAQKRQGRCLETMASHSADTLAWSVVSMQELSLGAAKSSHPQRLLAYMVLLRQRYQVLAYTSDCAEQAGTLQGTLPLQGTCVGPYDLQIAGIALACDLTIITCDVREFSRVPGLRVEDRYD